MTKGNRFYLGVLLYAPQSRPIQEDPWQTKQRLVKTRLAGAPPQKTATIAARDAKEPATQSNLTVTVVIPVAQETFKEFSNCLREGRIPRPFPFFAVSAVVGRIIQSRERSDRVALNEINSPTTVGRGTACVSSGCYGQFFSMILKKSSCAISLSGGIRSLPRAVLNLRPLHKRCLFNATRSLRSRLSICRPTP
jgi:hypothetical protein